MIARLLLFIFCGALMASAAPAPSLFDEAARLYDAHDFRGAREKYHDLLAGGTFTANVFYNLGNTEFRLERPGFAVLDYERALLLEPQHREATENLALVRSQSGAKMLPESPLATLLLPLSAPVYVLIAAIAFWVAVLSGAALLFWRSTPRGFIFVCAVSAVIAAYATGALWHSTREREVAIVVIPEASALLEAADRAGVAETLPAGSAVRVVSEHGEWIYCDLPGGGRGWLPRKSIEMIATAA